jgi:hypothetical protein
MLHMILEINKKEAYQKLPLQTKFIRAFTQKKRRFGYLVILWLIYFYDVPNKMKKWFVTRRAKLGEKYEIRWMHRYSPDLRVYSTASYNLYLPSKITLDNYEKLAKVFIEVDNQLLYGVSRQLILNVLNKMERMDSKIAKKFLLDSGYGRARARTLHSCDLIELCALLETVLEKVKNDKSYQQNQDELIDGFINLLPKEIQNFEDTIESVIKDMERKGQEVKSQGGLFG